MLETLVKTYLVAPFFASILVALFKFIKPLNNPIIIRRFTDIFFFIMFVLAFFTTVACDKVIYSFLGFDIYFDKFVAYALFLVGFIFLLFSFYSKAYVLKRRKIFYSMLIFLFSLINLALLSDSIFVFILAFFWILLASYLQKSIFVLSEDDKKRCSKQLACDIFCIIVSVFLICFDFVRYFLVNDISFNFSNIAPNLYKINDSTIQIAVLGFLILVARFFNLIPFAIQKIEHQSKTILLICFLQTISFLIIGSALFIKTYLNFDFIFYQLQDAIAIFLLANFIYYIILSFGQNDIFKFITNVFKSFLILGLFTIFSFEERCFQIYLYFMFVLCLSYALLSFVSIYLVDKSQTVKLDEMKRLNDKTRVSHLIVALSFLNIALIPLFPMFSAFIIAAISMFCVQYDGLLLNIIPYFLILGVVLICFSSLDVLRKVLIEPSDTNPDKTIFSFQQVSVIIILCFALFIVGFFPDYFLGGNNFVNIANS